MSSLLSRSVELEITNRTQSITLKNPRTYFECGYCYKQPLPELLPGSSDTPQFSGSSPFWGVAGVLIYEADSFTLAIYFSNPIDYNLYSIELALELSLSKAHRGRLAEIYARMAKGTYNSSFQDAKFACVTVDESHRTTQLSNSPIKVTATMHKDKMSILRVELEELCCAERGS